MKIQTYSTSNDLHYKGKKINFNTPVEMETLYFEHINLVNGFSKKAKRTHACLRFGYFCWKNILERPQDFIPYLKKKL